MKRFLKIGLVTLMLLIGAAWLVLYFYLHSSAFVAQVTKRLGVVYGAPISIAKIDVGLMETTISDLDLFEQDGNQGSATPWLKLHSVTVALPLWRVALGDAMPTAVDVKGAEVLLRLTDNDVLLTRVPEGISAESQNIAWKHIPQIKVEQAQVILRQHGHADLVTKNVNATVSEEAGRAAFFATAECEAGKLAISGMLDKATHIVIAKVSNDKTMHVTQGFLDRLPLPQSPIFQELRIHASDINFTLTATYDLRNKTLHYHGDLDARNAELYLAAASIFVHHASAAISIDDSIFELRAARAHVLGGDVEVAGKVDFRTPIKRLTLSAIKVENMDISDVPKSWNIPGAVRNSIAHGKLFGEAKLEVTIAAPAAALSVTPLKASGAADLLAGPRPQTELISALKSYDIRVESLGKGEVRDPAGEIQPIEFDWQLAPTSAHPGLNKAGTPRASLNIKALMSALLTVVPSFPGQDAQPKPKTPDNQVELKFNLKNARLADVVKNEDLKLPFAVDGKISFQLKATVAVDRLKDLKAYTADGSARVQQLVIGGVRLDEIDTNFHFDDGLLEFKTLSSSFPDKTGKQKVAGALSGNGRVQLVPLGELQADLKLDDIAVHHLAAQAPDQIDGTINGELKAWANTGKIQSAREIEADGSFSGNHLTIYGVALDKMTVSARFRDGVLSFPDWRMLVEGELITPRASLQVNDDQSFIGKVALSDWDVRRIGKIAATRKISLPALTGTINAQAVIQGKLTPPEISITGDIETQGLKVEAVETPDIKVHLELDGDKINTHAALFGGKMTGWAQFPLDSESEAKADFQVQDLDIKQLAHDLRMPVAMEGRVTGSLRGTYMPPSKDRQAKALFRVAFTSPKLLVQRIATDELQGTLEYRGSNINYNLTGKTLGGTFDLEGQIPFEAATPKHPSDGPKQGHLRVRGIHVGKLLHALAGDKDMRDFEGTCNIEIDFQHRAGELIPQGKGTLRLTHVQWRDTVLVEHLQASIVLADQVIRVRDLEGDLAQGRLQGRLVFFVNEPDRSEFAFNLDSAESSKLLAPWLNHKVQGPIRARFRGSLGRFWTGTGEISLANGNASGLTFNEWRVPMTWSYSPRQGRAELVIPEISGQVARGRATGKLTVTWDDSARIEGKLRLEGAELGDLLRKSWVNSQLGTTRTTAVLEIKGSSVHSVNDLQATLFASFEQAQATQVPVLQQITSTFGFGAAIFQKGTLVARLDRGIVQIQQLTLEGSNTQIFADGTVTLQNRLDLRVVAKTGSVGWPTAQLGPLGLRVPIAGPVPLMLLQEVSGILSNRVLYADVSGTVDSPRVRLRPLDVLSGEAVRYFLNRSPSPIVINP